MLYYDRMTGEVLDLRFSFSFFVQWIGNAKE